ncbi:rrf2 family protein, putative transcriptional regulator [Cylindrospermum stagnale PCC 7417]|uniref:Rrf2 family protein, putative transcriptional regulator n=1 Tax=Cylindrospermum stagnale PCC 7417 TaxID=56107 RepID=K9WWC1_9NOST|nr:Rrf2 family transcriptional regulator [Cylindrospermum stagnale]AFZ24094.1 rrf2 family protein, putative transcriptional regulator [Cylindrospermum stagnale PCC 7417]
MELSNKSEYAILALLELATCYPKGEPLQIREIAALQHIPSRYLEQLLATLRRQGLIKSIRGAKGGYVLAREPGKITLLDALNCMEGLDPVPSSFDPHQHTVEGEVIQDVWLEARQAANTVLQKYTLQDLCERRVTRERRELMYYI